MSKTDQEDKLFRVLDATEHPEQYSDEELEELLRDEECAAYYRLMCDAASAYAGKPEESDDAIDAEWQRIVSRQEHHRTVPLIPLALRKVAAVVIAVIVLSAVSYAAVRLIQGRQQPESESVAAVQEVTEQSSALPSEAEDSIHVFQNAEIQEILSTVSAYYQLQTEYRSEDARRVRLYIKWNKMECVDSLLQRLNHFDKVHLTLSNDRIIVE